MRYGSMRFRKSWYNGRRGTRSDEGDTVARKHELNWWRRIWAPILALPIGKALARYIVLPMDQALLPLTRGRVSLSALLYPTLLLTTIGARSGQTRTVPLLFLHHGEQLVLIASNYGSTRHPAWYFNLRANPVAQTTYRGRTRTFVAHEASGVEYDELWQRAVAYYPAYQAYRRSTAGRPIPIMVLTPHP